MMLARCKRVPLDRKPDVAAVLPLQPARTTASIQQRQRNQPPQGRIDAPEVPEVCLPALQVNELRDLTVRRLMCRQRVQPCRRRPLQVFVPRQGHADGAYCSVPPEDGRIAPPDGTGPWGSRQHAAGCEIAPQQLDGPHMAFVEKALDVRSLRPPACSCLAAQVSRIGAHMTGIIAASPPSR